MPAADSPQASLQKIVDIWTATKPSRFLSQDASSPLPTQGPLHKLLLATKRLLLDVGTFNNRQTAQDAVTTGAAAIMAKLASRLQQHPEQLVQDRSSLSTQLWEQLRQALTDITHELKPLPSGGDLFYQVLCELNSSGEEAEGENMSNADLG